jgi:hypothetical protein
LQDRDSREFVQVVIEITCNEARAMELVDAINCEGKELVSKLTTVPMRGTIGSAINNHPRHPDALTTDRNRNHSTRTKDNVRPRVRQTPNRIFRKDSNPRELTDIADLRTGWHRGAADKGSVGRLSFLEVCPEHFLTRFREMSLSENPRIDSGVRQTEGFGVETVEICNSKSPFRARVAGFSKPQGSKETNPNGPTSPKPATEAPRQVQRKARGT